MENPLETAPRKSQISAVIPCYNSEKTIVSLVQKLSHQLQGISTDFEIILVNDGSSDSTWLVLEGLLNHDFNIRIIDLARNFGQHNATLCGVLEAQYETIITLDDDFQNPPEQIQLLLDKLEQGFDIVYGVPRVKRHNHYRRWGSTLARKLLAGLGVKNAERLSSFRIFKQKLTADLQGPFGPVVCLDQLLNYRTDRVGEIEVNHEASDQNSRYNAIKLLQLTYGLIIAFNAIPFGLLILAGMALMLLSALGVVLLLAFNPLDQTAFTQTLLLVIGAASGLQLIGIGLLGELLLKSATINLPAFLVSTNRYAAKPKQGTKEYELEDLKVT
jgi:glycosyltransferase involved in cell wall biosynthesis